MKEIAPTYGCIIREEELKIGIAGLYDYIKQRVEAIGTFCSSNFESLHFLTAFFLLYKGLTHQDHCLPSDHEFIAPFKRTRAFVSQSFFINLNLNKLLDQSIEVEKKLDKLENFCEKLINCVITKGIKILIQIQVCDSKESHGIYGVLMTIPSSSSSTTKGIQLVLSNGGVGMQHHTPLRKNKRSSIHPGERRPMEWRGTGWEVYNERVNFNLNDCIKYKVIKIQNVNDKSQREAFCYYLMLCCYAKVLTNPANSICDSKKFITCLYKPKTNSIIHQAWKKQPSLEPLEIGDTEETMPKQIIGNCTVHNALYAISFAEALKPIERLFITYLIGIGIDRYRTLIELSRYNTNKGINNATSQFAQDEASLDRFYLNNVTAEEFVHSLEAARRLQDNYSHCRAAVHLKNLGVFNCKEQKKLEQLRYQHNKLQHEYDKNFGIIAKPF